MNPDYMQIAQTISSQLGGARFRTMTGSREFVAGTDGSLTFRVGRNSKGVNFCQITLTPADLYDVEYGFYRSGKFHSKAKSEGLYADQLQEDFTRHTGLYTRL